MKSYRIVMTKSSYKNHNFANNELDKVDVIHSEDVTCVSLRAAKIRATKTFENHEVANEVYQSYWPESPQWQGDYEVVSKQYAYRVKDHNTPYLVRVTVRPTSDYYQYSKSQVADARYHIDKALAALTKDESEVVHLEKLTDTINEFKANLKTFADEAAVLNAEYVNLVKNLDGGN